MTVYMSAPRPTTLLAHHAPEGFHYDWLIDPPSEADSDLPGLWTARVGLPWENWPEAGVVTAHALPPHRRRYLNWSGELSNGRGRVVVAAQGQVDIARWADTRIDATLYAAPLVLGLTLSRPSAETLDWQVAITPLPASHPGRRAIS